MVGVLVFVLVATVPPPPPPPPEVVAVAVAPGAVVLVGVEVGALEVSVGVDVLVGVKVGVLVRTGAAPVTKTPPENAELLLLLSRMLAVTMVRSGKDPGGAAENETPPEPLVVTWEVKISVSPCIDPEGFSKNSSVYWVLGKAPLIKPSTKM